MKINSKVIERLWKTLLKCTCLFVQTAVIANYIDKLKQQIFKETSHEPWWTVMEHWSPEYPDAMDAVMDHPLRSPGGCSPHHLGASPGHDSGPEWAGHSQL